MKYKIVTDSASDMLSLDGIDFSSVPLHIIVGEKDFIDDENIDIHEMQKALSAYKGKTSTSCPSPKDWITAFGDADVVFCVTITSGLSGSFASANIAKQMYEEDHPDRFVYIFDSRSTGPSMMLLIEKIKELCLAGENHKKINRMILDYHKHTKLLFALASVDNLAKNGRIHPLVAKGMGILGIRVVGIASEEGTLQPMDKCRGEKRANLAFMKHLAEFKYEGGKVIISHYDNLPGAESVKRMIEAEYGKIDCSIRELRGLCSYYAEPESVLLGFETA